MSNLRINKAKMYEIYTNSSLKINRVDIGNVKLRPGTFGQDHSHRLSRSLSSDLKKEWSCADDSDAIVVGNEVISRQSGGQPIGWSYRDKHSSPHCPVSTCLFGRITSRPQGPPSLPRISLPSFNPACCWTSISDLNALN